MGAGWQATLRPYQVDGVRWLWFMTRLGLGACLADKLPAPGGEAMLTELADDQLLEFVALDLNRATADESPAADSGAARPRARN